MPGTVTFPEMMQQFTIWLNAHKTTASSSSELEGTKTVRSSNFQEYLLAFGLDALGGNLPPAVQAATIGVGSSVTGVLETIPGGTTMTDSFRTSAEFVKSPFETLYTGIKNTLTDIDAYLSGVTGGPAESFATSVRESISSVYTPVRDNISAFTKSIAGGITETEIAGYSLKNVFSMVSDSAIAAQKAMGLTPVSLGSIAGTMTDVAIHQNFSDKMDELKRRTYEVDLSVPENLAYAEQAHTEALAAAQAIQDRIDSDKANMLAATRQHEAMQYHFTEATYINTLSDEHKAIYLTTMPTTTANAVSNLADVIKTPPAPNIVPPEATA